MGSGLNAAMVGLPMVVLRGLALKKEREAEHF